MNDFSTCDVPVSVFPNLSTEELVCVCLSNGLALKFDPNTPVNEVDGAFVIGGEAE